MVYAITVHITQQANAHFNVVEKKCYANGGEWTEKQSCHVLSMRGSGTSGMLRFKSRSGRHFAWLWEFITAKDGATSLSISKIRVRPRVSIQAIIDLAELKSYGINPAKQRESLHGA